MNLIIRKPYEPLYGMTVRKMTFISNGVHYKGLISCHNGFVTFQITIMGIPTSVFFQANDDDEVIDKASEILGYLVNKFSMEEQIEVKIEEADGENLDITVMDICEYKVNIQDLESSYLITIIPKEDEYRVSYLVETLEAEYVVLYPINLTIGRLLNDDSLK